jgi:acyl-CoA reductase-like NAD-dependent aldehyde dehydrogenase
MTERDAAPAHIEPAARIEPLAVALYESDCRERAGDMARRTTLSRIRAHYSFPAWTNLPPRERAAWRARAQKMLDECAAWLADEAAWDGP